MIEVSSPATTLCSMRFTTLHPHWHPVTLISPTTYDEITHGTEFPGYSRVINEFAEDVLQIGAELQSAKDRSVFVADFNRPLTGALQRAKTQYPRAGAAHRS